TDRCGNRAGQGQQLPPRVADPHSPALDVQEYGPAELLQVERVGVEDPPGGRVVRIKHLKAAVEQEPVDPIGSDAAADPVGRLDYDDLQTGPGGPVGSSPAGPPRA